MAKFFDYGPVSMGEAELHALCSIFFLTYKLNCLSYCLCCRQLWLDESIS